MFALVLTGPPGAGKTSVLEALSDALSGEDVGHATVEWRRSPRHIHRSMTTSG
jgi:predicted ATPase